MHDGIKKANATFTYALTLSAKLKKGQFVVDKKSRGFCDIDLMTADVQTGIPVIQDGDFAFVSVNDTDILSSLPRPIGDGCIEACCGCWDYASISSILGPFAPCPPGYIRADI